MDQACKSNDPFGDSGKRVSNAWITYRKIGDNAAKAVLIPNVIYLYFRYIKDGLFLKAVVL